MKLIASASVAAVEQILHPCGPGKSSKLASGWALGKPSARNRVRAILKRMGLDEEAITAQTLAREIDVIERIDRMIMSSGSRRNAILREMDRRHEFVQRLRETSDRITDGEFREVEDARAEAAE